MQHLLLVTLVTISQKWHGEQSSECIKLKEPMYGKRTCTCNKSPHTHQHSFPWFPSLIKIYHASHERTLMLCVESFAVRILQRHVCIQNDNPSAATALCFPSMGFGSVSRQLRRVLTLWLGRVIPNSVSVHSGSVESRELGHLAPGQFVSWVRLTWNAFQPYLTGVLFLKNKDASE